MKDRPEPARKNKEGNPRKKERLVQRHGEKNEEKQLRMTGTESPWMKAGSR